MFTYRQLDINDTDQLTDLLLERPEVFNGYTDDEFKNHCKTLAPTVLSENLWFVMGLFMDGKLHGVGMMREISNSPAWVWGHWVGRKTDFHKVFSEDGLKVFRAMDNDVFNEMEQTRKLNRYFVAYRIHENVDGTLKTVGMSDRFFQWLRSKGVNRGTSYKFFNDCIIEPNTLPKYQYQQAIVLNRTWPIKLGIRLGLKEG
jgi:hypothetical protein